MKESEKRIDAKLVLSILAAGIMSFSGVVVETAMNVTFPTLDEGVRDRNIYGAVDHNRLSARSCDHHTGLFLSEKKV